MNIELQTTEFLSFESEKDHWFSGEKEKKNVSAKGNKRTGKRESKFFYFHLTPYTKENIKKNK